MEYSKRKRVSRREIFLKKMDALIPWTELTAVIQPHYYAGKRGRPPRGIELMLRMYLLQVWYNLSDEMTEETIYDSYAMKEFVKTDFWEEGAPDAATLSGFRHLLEENKLRQQLFERINGILEGEGMMRHGGSIADAAIAEAPSSAKNSGKSRDPQMAQAKKGNEWHFGMKAHIGADAGTGMVHSASVTAANAHGIQEARRLVREDDGFVNGDAGYAGIEQRGEIRKSERLSGVEWRINRRKGRDRKREKELCKKAAEHLEYIGQPRWDGRIEYLKPKARGKAEHNFYIIKRLFGYRKARYRGLEKNAAGLYMLFAMANVLRWSWRLNPLGALPAAA